MTLYRAQLLLEPEQRHRLEEIAKREGKSLSEVARRALDAGLQVLESGQGELWTRRLTLMEKMMGLRRQIQEKHGIYQGNLIDDIREERDRDLDRIWRGD